MTASSTTYRRRNAAERRLTSNRLLVHAVGEPAGTILGGSAPVIWELLGQGVTTEDDIVAALLVRYSDTEDVIRAGVTAALADLVRADLLEGVP